MRHFLAGSWFKSTMACLACVCFLLLPCQVDAERSVEIKSKEDLSHKSGKLGTYRALVIGINDYQDKKIPALKTAVNDAREFADLLQTRYGFKVDLLLDRQATRKEIIDKLRGLAANSSADESVLIYYAGHGEIDRVLNDGWWVPADAVNLFYGQGEAGFRRPAAGKGGFGAGEAGIGPAKRRIGTGTTGGRATAD